MAGTGELQMKQCRQPAPEEELDMEAAMGPSDRRPDADTDDHRLGDSDLPSSSLGASSDSINRLSFVRVRDGQFKSFDLWDVFSDSEEFDPLEGKVKQILTLPSPDLVRGVHTATVMTCMGRILRNSSADEEEQDLAVVTDAYSAFLSHNWKSGRLIRFLALAFEYNFMFAQLATLLVLLLCVAASSLDFLPMFDKVRGSEYVKMGPWCLIVTVPFYWAMLLFRHELLALMGSRGPLMFLDKASIDQRNPVRRAAGIAAIPAFIGVSKYMLAIMTPMYFQNLWTMFELCTCLTVHPTSQLHVQPAYLAKIAILGSLVATIGMVVYTAVAYLGRGDTLLSMATLACCVIPSNAAFVFALRRWATALLEVQHKATAFNLETANCAEEGDRKMVKLAVAHFARKRGLVPETASREEARRSFEEVVRKEVPKVIRSKMGRAGVPWRFLFGMWLPILAAGGDSVSSDLRAVLLGTMPSWIFGASLFKFVINQSFCLLSWTLICFLCVGVSFSISRVSHWFARALMTSLSVAVSMLMQPCMAIVAQMSARIYTTTTKEPSPAAFAAGSLFITLNLTTALVLLRRPR